MPLQVQKGNFPGYVQSQIDQLRAMLSDWEIAAEKRELRSQESVYRFYFKKGGLELALDTRMDETSNPLGVSWEIADYASGVPTNRTVINPILSVFKTGSEEEPYRAEVSTAANLIGLAITMAEDASKTARGKNFRQLVMGNLMKASSGAFEEDDVSAIQRIGATVTPGSRAKMAGMIGIRYYDATDPTNVRPMQNWQVSEARKYLQSQILSDKVIPYSSNDIQSKADRPIRFTDLLQQGYAFQKPKGGEALIRLPHTQVQVNFATNQEGKEIVTPLGERIVTSAEVKTYLEPSKAVKSLTVPSTGEAGLLGRKVNEKVFEQEEVHPAGTPDAKQVYGTMLTEAEERLGYTQSVTVRRPINIMAAPIIAPGAANVFLNEDISTVEMSNYVWKRVSGFQEFQPMDIVQGRVLVEHRDTILGKRTQPSRRGTVRVGRMAVERDEGTRVSDLTLGAGTSALYIDTVSHVRLPAFVKKDLSGWAVTPSDDVMPTPDYLVDMLQKRFGGLTLVTRDSTLPTPEFGFYVANEVTTNISGAGVKAGYARQPFRAPKMTVKSSAGKTASVRVDAITGEIKSPEIMFSEGTLPMLSEEQRREILATYLERKFGAGFAAGLGKEMDAAFGNRQYSIGGLHKFISGFVAARGKSLGDMQPLQFGYDIFKTVFAVDQEGKPITPESEQNVENLQRYGIGLVQNTARELWSADTLRFNIENIKSAIRKQQPELTEEEIEQKARSIYKIEPAKRDGFFIVQPANQVGWVMPFGAIPKAEYAGKGKIALPMVRSSLTGREREIYEWMGIAPSQLSQENPEETAWRDLYRWAAYQKSKVFSDEIGISEDKVFRVGGLTEEGQARLLQAKRIVDTYDPNAPNDLERMMKELARTLGNGRDITGQHIILEETGAILPTIRSVMSALEYSDEATGQQKSYGGAEVARLFKKQIDLAIASLGGATEETYARRDEISSGLLEYVEDVFAAGENAFKQLTTKTKGFVSGTYRYDTMTFLQDEEVYIPPQVRHRMLINAGFSRKEIKAFERAFAKGELKTSMPILFQRSPDIGFSLFMNAITDKDLMNRIRAAGTKISRKDFDRLIRNDISFQNIVFVSQRASELQTGDFDRDIASIVALVKKKYDKDGNLTFETPQVEGGWANFVNEYMEEAARTLRAAYGEEFGSLVSAAEGAASDVVEGKNPLGKGKFASFSAREALDVSVDRRAQMTVGMGTTYNVKRYLAPAMSLTGASDEDIARALTQTQANYQVFLDTLATGTPDTTGTPLSTILSSASIHLGEDETPYLSFSTDTAYTTQERTVGGKKVEADIVGRNRRVRILAGDPASTYAGFLQALNIAAKRKVLKKGGKAHEYEITPPDLIYNIAALNEEMRREMKSYAVEKYGEKHTSEQAAFAAQAVWGKYIQQGDKKQRQLQVMQTPLMRSLTARALQKSESGEIFGRDEVQRQWLARRISAGEAPMEIAKDIAVSAMSYFEKRAGVIGADVLQIAANVFEPFAKTNSLFAGGWLKIMERLGVKPRAGLDIARLLPINVEQEEIPAIEKQPERTFAASVYAGKRAEDYLVVDTETFAAPGTVGQKVSPKNQIPWQIAFAEAENPASVQQYLIRPEGVTKEDYERAKEEMMAVRPEVAEKMPSWETLEREGISYADALKKLRSAAKGRTIAGYNVGFDVGVLEAETMRYAVLGKGGKFLQKAAAEIQSGKPLFERVHDVMAGIRKIFSSEVDAYLNVDDENEKARRRKALGKYRLSGMYEAVSMADNLTGGLTPEQAHSADADVLATSYLLTKAIERGNADEQNYQRQQQEYQAAIARKKETRPAAQPPVATEPAQRPAQILPQQPITASQAEMPAADKFPFEVEEEPEKFPFEIEEGNQQSKGEGETPKSAKGQPKPFLNDFKKRDILQTIGRLASSFKDVELVLQSFAGISLTKGVNPDEIDVAANWFAQVKETDVSRQIAAGLDRDRVVSGMEGLRTLERLSSYDVDEIALALRDAGTLRSWWQENFGAIAPMMFDYAKYGVSVFARHAYTLGAHARRDTKTHQEIAARSSVYKELQKDKDVRNLISYIIDRKRKEKPEDIIKDILQSGKRSASLYRGVLKIAARQQAIYEANDPVFQSILAALKNLEQQPEGKALIEQMLKGKPAASAYWDEKYIKEFQALAKYKETLSPSGGEYKYVLAKERELDRRVAMEYAKEMLERRERLGASAEEIAAARKEYTQAVMAWQQANADVYKLSLETQISEHEMAWREAGNLMAKPEFEEALRYASMEDLSPGEIVQRMRAEGKAGAIEHGIRAASVLSKLPERIREVFPGLKKVGQVFSVASKDAREALKELEKGQTAEARAARIAYSEDWQAAMEEYRNRLKMFEPGTLEYKQAEAEYSLAQADAKVRFAEEQLRLLREEGAPPEEIAKAEAQMKTALSARSSAIAKASAFAPTEGNEMLRNIFASEVQAIISSEDFQKAYKIARGGAEEQVSAARLLAGEFAAPGGQRLASTLLKAARYSAQAKRVLGTEVPELKVAAGLVSTLKAEGVPIERFAKEADLPGLGEFYGTKYQDQVQAVLGEMRAIADKYGDEPLSAMSEGDKRLFKQLQARLNYIKVSASADYAAEAFEQAKVQAEEGKITPADLAKYEQKWIAAEERRLKAQVEIAKNIEGQDKSNAFVSAAASLVEKPDFVQAVKAIKEVRQARLSGQNISPEQFFEQNRQFAAVAIQAKQFMSTSAGSAKVKELFPEIAMLGEEASAAEKSGVKLREYAKEYASQSLSAMSEEIAKKYQVLVKLGEQITKNFAGIEKATEEQLALHERQISAVKAIGEALEAKQEAATKQRIAIEKEGSPEAGAARLEAVKAQQTAIQKEAKAREVLQFLPKQAADLLDEGKEAPEEIQDMTDMEKSALIARMGRGKSGLGAVLREMLGGFGLMYIRSAIAYSTSSWGADYEATSKMRMGIGTSGAKGFGDRILFGEEQRYSAAQAFYGDLVDPKMALARAMKENKFAGDIFNMAASGLMTTSAFFWTGELMEKQSGRIGQIGQLLKSFAVPAAIGLQFGAAMVESNMQLTEQKEMLGMRSGAYAAKYGSKSALFHGVGFGDALSMGIGAWASMLAPESIQAKSYQETLEWQRVGVHSQWAVQNDLSFGETVRAIQAELGVSEQEAARMAYAGRITASTLDEMRKMYGQEANTQLEAFLRRNPGLELTKKQQERYLAGAATGVNYEELAALALRSVGVSSGQATAKRTQYEAVTRRVTVEEPGETRQPPDVGRMLTSAFAMPSGGMGLPYTAFDDSEPKKREIEKVEVIAKEVTLQGEMVKSMLESQQLQDETSRAIFENVLKALPAGSVATEEFGARKGQITDAEKFIAKILEIGRRSEQEIASTIAGLATSYEARKYGIYENEAETLYRKAISGDFGKREEYDALQAAISQAVEQRKSSAYRVLAEDAYWGSSESGMAIYRKLLAEKDPRKAAMLGQIYGGDPMMLASIAGRLDLSAIRLPTVDGRGVSANLLALTDTDLGGSLTGLSWAQTSLRLGSWTNQEMAGRLLGFDWRTNKQYDQALLGGIVGGVQLPGKITLPDGRTIDRVGGMIGADWQMMYRQREIDLQQRALQQQSFNLQLTYTPKQWALDDAMRALNRRQEDWQYNFSQRQMAMQERYYQENIGLQRRQTLVQRGWAMEDWAMQANIRNMQWGWRVEDFNEEIRFMTGRQRKIAERQMRRETTMHNIEEEQISKQQNRQKELWRMEDERFAVAKRQHAEQLAIQREQLETMRKFTLERRKIEDEQVKLSREQWKKQMEIQKQSIALSNRWADEQYKLQTTMKMLEVSTKLTAAQINTLSGEAMTIFRERLLAVNPPLTQFVDQILRLKTALDGGSANAGNVGGGGGVGRPPIFAMAGGGIPDPSRVVAVGGEGVEFLLGGVVIPHDKANELYNLGVRPGDYASDVIGKINRLSFGGGVVYRNEQQRAAPTPINIYIGNQRIASLVVDALSGKLLERDGL